MDLLEIWHYIASESSNRETADRYIDAIAERFLLLARNPHLGRSRSEDLQPGLRSFSVGQYLIFYRVKDPDVLILRILHGRRDIHSLLEE